MIFIDCNCDICIYKRENIGGWRCACDAFPEGIPKEYLYTSKKPEEMIECNNGIGFKRKPEE